MAKLCHLKSVVRAAEGETPRWAARFWIDRHIGVMWMPGRALWRRGWSLTGKEAGAGGFGATVGDEGRGLWISLQAIRAVLQAFDGRLEETRLAPVLLERLGLSTPGELPFQVTGGFISAPKLLEAREAREHIGVMIDSGHILSEEASTARNKDAARTGERS